ncbi:reverse transcriptase [Senna tora]|uniref:Reverse transcriptase n=1 Tax=Senna tora TaxID=362788 RepID=A0A834WS39_9FABA|nr:reverse transcriptase [Senna tora]
MNSGPNPHLIQLEQSLALEYQKILDQEEELWASKARLDWLQLGDSNTSFFHSSVINRRRKNKISAIKDSSGNWLFEFDRVKDYITKFFKECFQSQPVEVFPRLDLIPTIDSSSHPRLEGAPSPEEIKTALWDLKPFKAAGIDGFQPGFFQNCWGFLEERAFNFPPKLIALIESCISSVQQCILINRVSFKTWTPLQVRKIKISHLLFADDVLLFARTDVNSVNAVKDVLDRFVQSSGLSINNSKSSIWFAPCTSDQEKMGVIHKLNFKVDQKPGIYLGHPLGIGNRVSDYKPIVDKLTAKMEIWNSKMLSKAGKLTLLNSVCSPMLAYYMQCTKLPATVCNSIERLQRNFFWQSGNKQSIHIINWGTICKPKDMGGLGVERIRERNLALLAKLLWRTSDESNQIWAKILACYTVDDKRKGSVVGKRIQWGSKLLNAGMCSIIYSGRNTSVWRDKWLGCSSLRSLVYGPLNFQEELLSVNSFAAYGGGWEWDKLSFQVLEFIKQQIEGIPCFKSSSRDDIKAWSYCVSGKFNLKSAYWLALCQNMGTEFSSSSNFKWVWKIACPEKIKVFVWFCLNNALPCRANIIYKGIQVPNVCPICNQDNETQLHILRDCSYARRMWGNLKFISANALASCSDWIFSNVSDNSDFCEQVSRSSVFVFGLWELWLNRNRVIFQDLHSLPASSGRKVFVKSVEFSHLAKDFLPKVDINRCWVKWVPPPDGWLKLNTDGSCLGNPGSMAAAGIIRDSNGNWISGFSKQLGFGNSLKAELWAIALGIKLAKDLACERLVVESDSLYAVNLITDNNICVSHALGPLTQFCRSTLRDFSDVQIRHTFREGNSCADSLAKHANLSNSPWMVYGSLPDFLRSCFFADYVGTQYVREVSNR